MEKQIIEINGIKLEIDMRHAKKIENYKVGDSVKVLEKSYNDSYKVHAGVIVGFDQFNSLPTITICYVEISYSDAEIKMIYLNKETKGFEIVHMNEYENKIDKSTALDLLDRNIFRDEEKLREMRNKRDFFVSQYQKNIETFVN